MSKSLFEFIQVVFQGGPKDGINIAIQGKNIPKTLCEVEGTPNMMLCRFPTLTNPCRRHVYMSNGPVDFPLLETHIYLHYEGIKDE